ncbi:MAG: PD-(D/E)XK nuclease family protein, partial [Actinomycetota bacterium]|nr:PD-(D/E)XK nuclease family protein [Actinomycetota bacterium]
QQEKGPSQFWDELAELEDRGLLSIVRRDEVPKENPLFSAMEDRRHWPPPARIGVEDDLFPQGWGSAADAVVSNEVRVDSLLQDLSADERAAAETLIAGHQRDLSLIAAAQAGEAAPEPEVPDILSATACVRLENGDIEAWDLIRPLPERPTAARRIGTEVHRIIEERSRGISPYPDETELDEPSEVTEPSVISRMLTRFNELGYADRTIARLPSGEPMIELPFAMKKDGKIIRGRIDAVYETEEGGLEIVDFKTGKHFEKPEGADQLDIYSEALQSMLASPSSQVEQTYLFLDRQSRLAHELDSEL